MFNDFNVAHEHCFLWSEWAGQICVDWWLMTTSLSVCGTEPRSAAPWLDPFSQILGNPSHFIYIKERMAILAAAADIMFV